MSAFRGSEGFTGCCKQIQNASVYRRPKRRAIRRPGGHSFVVRTALQRRILNGPDGPGRSPTACDAKGKSAYRLLVSDVHPGHPGPPGCYRLATIEPSRDSLPHVARRPQGGRHPPRPSRDPQIKRPARPMPGGGHQRRSGGPNQPQHGGARANDARPEFHGQDTPVQTSPTKRNRATFKRP